MLVSAHVYKSMNIRVCGRACLLELRLTQTKNVVVICKFIGV